MTRGLLTLLFLVAGCPTTHLADDAGVDARPGLDAPRIETDAHALDAPDARADLDAPAEDARDAPIDTRDCDADDDGSLDPECGGPDCDPTTPAIFVGSVTCSSPTESLACGESGDERTPCEAGEVCDARTGTCASSACGDGVLHTGESCDDGNDASGDGCAPDCTWPPCVWNGDCPAGAPSCSEILPDGVLLRCRPLQTGVGVGDRCSADVECASAWCDVAQGRCTQGCSDASQCVLGDGHCIESAPFTDPPDLPRPQRCAFGCYSVADCPAGSACRLTYGQRLPPSSANLSFCDFAGTDPDGAACRGGEVHNECASLICQYGEPAGAVFCASLCSSDAECSWPTPDCIPVGSAARPAGWRDDYPHACGRTFGPE